jgi:hypothetical protein
MKQFGRFLTKAVAYGVAVAAVCSLVSSQAAEGKATVRSIRFGAAEYSDDGVTWKTLAIGNVLKTGQTVKTDAKAVVDLFLKDNGPVVRVTPATSLKLTTLTFEEAADETVITTELGLSNGRILGAVKKLAAASKYDVNTPVGTCSIRGTQYDISVSGRATVLEGTVVVRYTSPTGAIGTFVVQVGQTFDPAANNGEGGVAPTPPAEQQSSSKEIEASIRITTTTPIDLVTIVAPPKPPDQPPVQEPTTKTGP